jgi:hypothetical protein
VGSDFVLWEVFENMNYKSDIVQVKSDIVQVKSDLILWDSTFPKLILEL